MSAVAEVTTSLQSFIIYFEGGLRQASRSVFGDLPIQRVCIPPESGHFGVLEI